MTVSQPRSQCTTSGTVAAPHFHFYVGWKGPLAFLVVDWILVEELTNEHTPQIWYFANPQGSNGFPQGCSMLPVSDPQNWRWMTWNFPMTAGFWMHNSPYRVTVQWRYWVQMKGQRGPFQTSIEVNVQNLVVTSGDVGKVLKWDPERPELCDTSFGYSITCAQRKQVQVKISIYSMDGAKVYELTEQKICPGSYSFTWNGSMSMGQYGGGYQGEGPTNVAPSGLYTFDVEVTGSTYYHDADWLRSKELRVVPGPVEYYGYDDGGTPEDESDDNYLYYLRWYALYSGRDATWGEIWLYDPDFERVGSWAVPMLICVAHGWNDGLEANPNGEVHGVIIPVPVSVMEKAGTYRFVLHFYDDFADSYKNHQVKAALEVNTHAQGLTFTIFTDPTHPKEDKKGHPGHHKGTRESMEFYVIIKAKTSLPKGKKPPKEIRFWLKRKMGEEMEIKKPDLELKGFLIKEESKGEVTEYIYQTHRTLTERGVTDWIITKKKGRWIIQVAKPHTSNNHTSNNIVEFKINKREQIVIVAKSWDGAEEKERWHGPCWGFAAEVYNHVGISLPSNETQYDKTIEDKVSVKARLVFFWVSDSPAHVAIQTDIGNIIDINCSYYENGKIETHKNEFGKRIVKEHDLGRLLNYYRKHEFKSTKELQELDGE